MNEATIQRERRELASQLRAYLRAERRMFDQSFLRCPRCGGSAIFNEKNALDRRCTPEHGDWYCTHCGAEGDVVDYVLFQHPHMDEGEALRHLHRCLGLKITQLEGISANDLMDTELPPSRELVERLLGNGCWLLVGDSKIGKSWLVLSLARAVSRGEPFLGLKSRRCEVLYLSLEDSEQNIQQRLAGITGGNAPGIWIASEAELLGDGLEEQLSNWLIDHPNLGLIVIDTLQKVRRSGAEQYSYSADYSVISAFKSLAARFNVCILLVHHTRKQEASDVYDMVSGTTGLMGAADGTMMLHKKRREDDEALLSVTSRVLPSLTLRLRQNEQMEWELVAEEGNARPCPENPLLRDVAQLVALRGAFEGTATELWQALPPREDVPNGQVLSRRLNAFRAVLEQQYGLSLRQHRTGQTRLMKLCPLPQRDAFDAIDAI